MWESRWRTNSAWWEEKRPVSALRSSGSFRLSLPRANSARASGSFSALAELGEHRPPRGAEHPRRDRRELDVGVLEQLLQTVGFALALPHQRLAIARQIAQLADRLRRREASRAEAVLRQLDKTLGASRV